MTCGDRRQRADVADVAGRLPTLSQNTARVFSSISFSTASAASEAAKRTSIPWLDRMWANSVCVVP
jgi:hypothetical protein